MRAGKKPDKLLNHLNMADLKDTRFTLMAFPQEVDAAGHLTLHILFIPRNFNPLTDISTRFGTNNLAPAFADVQPIFQVKVVNNPDEFPGKVPAGERSESTDVTYSDVRRKIYERLKDAKDEEGKPKYFDIDDSFSAGQPSQSPDHRAPEAVPAGQSIRKYLPVTYRNAFNFTSPRLKNAVTDDSYHCAMRNNKPPLPVPETNKISWGKVYAHLLRQPLLAEKAGLLYKTVITLKNDDFKKGGWLYIDVVPSNAAAPGPYVAEQQKSIDEAGELFIKRYAARIPSLKKAADDTFIARSLFAAVLFPVVKEGESPTGIYDELYLEAAEYNDGFAKIVHVNQPVSGNLLSEEQDGFHPQKEMGIRLGWDDEQILTWYVRQLSKDISVNGGADRLDAPMGVMGYHIDVKDDDLVGADFESLTAVVSNGDMILEDDAATDDPLNLGSFEGELPFQVYPVKIYDGEGDKNYWLPMYFSNWNDHSLVLPDKTAAEIYQNKDAIQRASVNDLASPVKNRNVKITDTYSARTSVTQLRYGKAYKFRVRLTDITGGGPSEGHYPAHTGLSNEAYVRFKRYVAPQALRISNQDIIHSTDDLNFKGDILLVKRPLLGYPAVVYTDGYKTQNAAELLKLSVQEQLAKYVPGGEQVSVQIGLADPDVEKVLLKVEVETLQMDNLASDTGKENYITLYEAYRKFDANNFDAELALQFEYKDYPVLNMADLPLHPFHNEEDDASIIAEEGILILPTCRNIRVTIRGICAGSDNYWGSISSDPELNSRYGKTTSLKMRKDTSTEPQLFTNLNSAQLIKGIYLQPDPQPLYTGKMQPSLTVPSGEGLPDIVERFAKELDLSTNKMTLYADKGERVQFWCSSLIRHTLSPDNSSITFAGKHELVRHWLVVTTLYINRDWTWDGLETLSFSIGRRKSLDDNPVVPEVREQKINSMPLNTIGTMELRRTAPFQAIQKGDDGIVHREYTKIIFIDVVDPLAVENKRLDTILLQYVITPNFKKNINYESAFFQTPSLLLPATINPHQVPKVIGSGIALSPYVTGPKYAFTEARKRYLWLEFDQAPEDERDSLFARQVAYAPDQLLSNNHPSLYEITEDPPLTLDPEYTRVIVPESAHDHPGLRAMQKMEKSGDERHFYLLPLPEGIHSESAELFGFYTYEFRFGHTDELWSTAQGRFGRRFRLAGLQHPAPNLLCMVNRDDKELRVTAPCAVAVNKGKNVTADPPRTAIWCLLYAQVRQADGRGYRNILLNEKKLLYSPGRTGNKIKRYESPGEYSEELISHSRITLNMRLALAAEAVKYVSGTWKNSEIDSYLELYGLPADSSLSVLCVEVFGQIHNIADHVTDLERVKEELIDSITLNMDKEVGNYLNHQLMKPVERTDDQSFPLSDHLGLHRILRTSPLTAVPFVCCTD